MDEVKKYVRAGVGVMILRDGKILLGRRNADPVKASSELGGQATWTMPGGKIDFGEKIADAARRELSEETGLAAKTLRIASIGNEIKDNAHFVTVGFVCEDFEGEPKIMEPEEIEEWKWFQIDSLPENIFPPSRKLLQNYINKEIYKGD